MCYAIVVKCYIQTSPRGWSSVRYHERYMSWRLRVMDVLFPVHIQTRPVIIPTLVLQTMEIHSLKEEYFSLLPTSQELVSPVRADTS